MHLKSVSAPLARVSVTLNLSCISSKVPAQVLCLLPPGIAKRIAGIPDLYWPCLGRAVGSSILSIDAMNARTSIENAREEGLAVTDRCICLFYAMIMLNMRGIFVCSRLDLK